MLHVETRFAQNCGVATECQNVYQRRCGGSVHFEGTYGGAVSLIHEYIHIIVVIFFVNENECAERN